MSEAGIAAFDASVWYGLVAPKGTPAEIIARLNTETHKALASPDLSERLARLGNDPAPSTAQAFAEFIAEQTEFWRRALQATGIKAD